MIPVVLGWIQKKKLGKVTKIGEDVYIDVQKEPTKSTADSVLRLVRDKSELVLETVAPEDQTIVMELKKRRLIEESRRSDRQ